MPERSSSCGVLSAPAATTTAPARTVCRSPASSTYSTPVASPPSIRHALDRSRRPAARGSRAPARRRCTCSSSTCRRSSGSPGCTSRSSCSSRRCTSGPARARRRAHGSPARPCGRSSPSRSRSRTPSTLLDAVVVRLEVRDRERLARRRSSARRRMPLGDVALVRAERDLRVDRRRAADAAAGEEGDELAVRRAARSEAARRGRAPPSTPSA